MAKGYLYDNGYELISREEALPDTSEASEGDILSLNSEKEPEWSTPESGLPDTTSASAGDVLSLDEDKEPVWSAPSGGGGGPLVIKATGVAVVNDTDPDNITYLMDVDKTVDEISEALDPSSYVGAVVLFPTPGGASENHYSYDGVNLFSMPVTNYGFNSELGKYIIFMQTQNIDDNTYAIAYYVNATKMAITMPKSS